jgi:trafficking protein particle complex subunit 9
MERGEQHDASETFLIYYLQPGGTRHGELHLRGQRLTAPMMQTLKTDPVRVALQLVKYADDSDGEGSTVPSINGRVYTQPTQFYALQCRAFNAAGGYCSLLLCRC